MARASELSFAFCSTLDKSGKPSTNKCLAALRLADEPLILAASSVFFISSFIHGIKAMVRDRGLEALMASFFPSGLSKLAKTSLKSTGLIRLDSQPADAKMHTNLSDLSRAGAHASCKAGSPAPARPKNPASQPGGNPKTAGITAIRTSHGLRLAKLAQEKPSAMPKTKRNKNAVKIHGKASFKYNICNKK